MWNWIRSKYRRMFYNQNFARKKSYNKYQNAIVWYVDLIRKEKKEWLTKWIAKTRVKADARIKKYGITKNMINDYLQDKWFTDLLS